MKKRGRKALKKEDYSEEWCFVCKDGGDMIICDHKDCFKSYHPECVELDDSSAKAKSRFICGLHKCESCRRTSDVHCYCCPKGVCRRCIKSADFVHVHGKKGFCEYCLKLTLLVEEKKDVDSDGETIDFNNRETYETLYKEYWEIINATEKLTLEALISAKNQLKSGKNYDSDKYEDSDEYQFSDYEENDDMEEPHDSGKKKKRSKPEPSEKKVKAKSTPKSKKNEFTGWGSTRLMQFLTNVGKDSVHALSQRELEKIIKGYAKDKDLIQKNKVVECDVWLQTIFGRKTVKLNRIYDLLETHLAENQVSSDEEDEIDYDSDEINEVDEVLVVNPRKKKNNGDKIAEKKGVVLDPVVFHFAAIVPENIRLVYLRRSLVQKLEKEPDSFESKVIGTFVRVKEDLNGCFSKSYQLMQVTGVKSLVGENGNTFVLQALETEICITSLSDDEFSEEECQDLKKKVKSGILKKLTLVRLRINYSNCFLLRTVVYIVNVSFGIKIAVEVVLLLSWITILLKDCGVVELEEKAKSLHKDIVTHYLERRQFLQNPTNQTKLLEKVPTVVPDIEEDGPVEDDKKDSPKSSLTHTSSGNFKDNAEESKHEVPASEKYAMAMKLQKFFGSMEVQHNPKKPSVVKNPTQLFESVDTISKEEVEDTESSQWFITSPHGEKVGPVSLSVLKNWSQTQAASETMIYKSSQSDEKARPLNVVLRLAFPRK
ncbi:hypothetical protein OSB04_016500 [Centaurea solstitialis]|uniref:Plus3 domain-containing protein n=1 Tax=Centaurea solstitialis TaxID=347529 RepID=A0AA38WHH8_9ASTR|nr:hypothetical protein OSB04_016500 [Centaurea solstitialis]